MNKFTKEELGRDLTEAGYLRQRTKPSLFDINYLHLLDLYALMQRFSREFAGEVFDYGCGGAPYRGLFTNCVRYIKADVTPNPIIDRLLGADGMTQEPEASFDLVVSTQVLEHVSHPERYLRECFRILRPAGRLLLTTHGMIEEHGCPHDYYRWTGRGLEVLVSDCGFSVRESGKLTTELRALSQLSHQLMLHLRCDGRPLVHYPLAVLRKAYFLLCLPGLNYFAGRFPGQAFAATDSSASLYTGVYVWAQK